MSKSKGSNKIDIIAAAEEVYAILVKHNIKACAIGSMAIKYTTKKSLGRDPNTLDFATFRRGHDQRSLNKLLLINYHDLFVASDQSDAKSHLAPLLFYKPTNSRVKIRVFFLPLWTRHSQENIPSLRFSDIVEPKSPYTVPLAPLPYLIYLQLHGWAWSNSNVRGYLGNTQANTRRDTFTSDLCFLLPLGVKRHAHFDWLSDEFKKRLKSNANEFVQQNPALCQEWIKMDVSGVEVKLKTTSSDIGSSAMDKHFQGEEMSTKEGNNPIKGDEGHITRQTGEQPELMDLDNAHTERPDFDN